MAAEGGAFVTFIFTGEDGGLIPWNATHLIIHESVTVIPAFAIYNHPNIIEVYCHVGVKRIERLAFYCCPRLRRVMIPGVEVLEYQAFFHCEAVTDIECPKLEIVGYHAFQDCKSLSSINLPSAKLVTDCAFNICPALTEAEFGKNLESIRNLAFRDCPSLERITIPLKNGLIADDNIFRGCEHLKRVDLVEREALNDTIDALLLEEWKNDMNREVDSVNQELLNTYAGNKSYYGDAGGKARVIRDWIERVLRKIIDYKAQHRRLVNEAASTLQLALPKDVVMNYIAPLLELPSHTFEGEGERLR